ncbi:MAG: tRNA lysidine(34) synthetase TilS, partial [Pedosphaera parvula]|nr:tRNA lysidine(34) synthetase TilS [Pedosphaera parvula]
MNDLLLQVAESIRCRKLLRRQESVLVGVSGGLDSSVLLSVLHRLARRHGWRLVVGHFNHGLRGAESDRDERFVKAMARRLRLRFVTGRGDVKEFARRNGLSVEMAARALRHGFFADAARRWEIRTVALAHHADDQVELFFLRLFRGAGGEGLEGMKWRGAAPFGSHLRLIRPLLDVRKEQLAAYAGRQGIAFREDA